MEAKVHDELLSFLAQHGLQDTVNYIDGIILSYLVGVVELIGQGDDGLDIVELTEMMNAFLPGFDQIGSAEVIDWMLGLAHRLMGSSSAGQARENVPGSLSEDTRDRLQDGDNGQDQKKFPVYDYLNQSALEATPTPLSCVNQQGHAYSSSRPIAETQVVKSVEPAVCVASTCSELPSSETFPTQNNQLCSKRKGRQLSCSSQDSQDDPKQSDTLVVEEAQVRLLLDMFPSACSMEAQHCLQLSSGDMDQAAQLIMDRQETGQSIRVPARSRVTNKNHKVIKIGDMKLKDDIIKSCVLEKYAFIDTEDDKKIHRPPPVKKEAKKLVRYRDGQVVSMKGEKFSEVKTKEDDDMKATYVSLQPARKYRFH